MTAKTNRKEEMFLDTGVKDNDVVIKENPISSKVLMIPKFRFDEVNEKYKKYKRDIVILNDELKDKKKENKKLLDDIKCIRKAYENALLNLKVKETFVEGGILKEQYDTIIPKMTCKESEKLDLAKAIVGVLKKQK